MKKRGLLRSTALVSGNTLISRILGFVRDMVVAHAFGASAGADAFYVAFKLPNFMRRLFAEGAFTQAFVPVLSEYQATKSPQEVKDLVDRICGSLGMALLIFVLIAMLAAPLVMDIFAPGFHADNMRYELATHMLRVMFPYLFFISLTAFCSSILNTYGQYGVPAFTPVLLNICMIISAVWLAHYFTIPIFGLAWGVFFAGIIQLLFQLPFLAKIKLMPVPRWGWHDSGVRRVLKLMVPALFGVSVAQINLLLDTVFASFLQIGSVSWLYYSDRLMNFPLGIFGVAIATVILPHLSRASASQNHDNYSKTLDWSVRMLLLIGIPASLGLIVMSGPLLATLLHYGAFNNHDVLMTQQSLIAFSFGVQGFMLVKVFASGFYAKQNIKTPVKIGVIAMVSNMVLNLALIFPLKHAGLALATSLSGYINSGLLLYLLRKYKIYQPQPGWVKFAIQLILANLASVIFLLLSTPTLSEWLNQSWEWRYIHLFGLIIPAVLIYVAMLFATGLRVKHFRLHLS